MNTPSYPRRFLFLLALLVILPYYQVVGFAFINLDDPYYLGKILHVRNGLSWEGVQWAFTDREHAMWMPVTWLSFMLESTLSGGITPSVIHSVNVFFHLCNTLLLFWLIARLTGVALPALFAAAVFAVHPQHVEAVAWATERKEVLAGFFGLLAMHAHLFRVAARGEAPRAWRWGLAAFAFMLLSLWSKPMWLTLPFVLLLLDLWPLGRLSAGVKGLLHDPPRKSSHEAKISEQGGRGGLPHMAEYDPPRKSSHEAKISEQGGRGGLPHMAEYDPPRKSSHEAKISEQGGCGGLPHMAKMMDPYSFGCGLAALREKWPLFFLTFLFAGITLLFASGNEGLMPDAEKLPIATRLGNTAVFYIHYLQQTLWPVDLSVLNLYPQPPYGAGPVAAAGGLLLAVTAWAVWQVRQRPWWLVSWLWFLGALFPVSGVMQAGRQSFADRFTYYPHMGLALLLAVLALPLLKRSWGRMVAGGLVGALCLLTFQQVGHWQDSGTIWQQALRTDAGHHYAHWMLGLHAQDGLHHAEAVDHFQRAVTLYPRSTLYRVFLKRAEGESLMAQGRFDQALVYFQEALDLELEEERTHAHMGKAHLLSRRYREAIRHLTLATAKPPPATMNWHSEALFNLGIAHLSQGEVARAKAPLQASLKEDPDGGKERCQTALAYYGRTQERKTRFPAALPLLGQVCG